MAIVCTLEKKRTEDRYYARSRKTGSVGFDQFSEEIASNCSAKPSDVILVLTELCDVMRHHLLAGEEIDIPGLGSFHVGVKSDSVENPSDFDAERHIHDLHIVSGFDCAFGKFIAEQIGVAVLAWRCGNDKHFLHRVLHSLLFILHCFKCHRDVFPADGFFKPACVRDLSDTGIAV